MIKIEMLRCFVNVAQTGNLADAAHRLCRTPSAVSMMLKQFEAHLGAPLFESERKAKLTTLGAFVLDESMRGLQGFERAVSAIERYARSESGFVRIAAVPSVAVAILPGVVNEFRRERPGVRIEVREMDSAAVVVELEHERVDLGIASRGSTSSEIQGETLFSDAFGIVCRADHPLADNAGPLEWETLDPYPFIANGVCGVIADKRFQRNFLASSLMVRNTAPLLAMVRANVGVTVLPNLAVGDMERELVFLTVADPSARRRIDILRRAHTSPPPAVRTFEAAIISVASGVAGALQGA